MLLTNIEKGQALASLLHKEFPGYHPLVSIARIAHHQDADLRLQFECHKTIAKYIEPELKSVEVKSEENVTKRVKVSLFDYEEVDFKETTQNNPTPTLGNW